MKKRYINLIIFISVIMMSIPTFAKEEMSVLDSEIYSIEIKTENEIEESTEIAHEQESEIEVLKEDTNVIEDNDDFTIELVEEYEEKSENNVNEGIESDSKGLLLQENDDITMHVEAVNLLSEGTQAINDQMSGANETKTYTIKVDYSNIDSICIGLIKTSESDMSMEVMDSNGNVKKVKVNGEIPKNRIFINKGTNNVEEYQITIQSINYVENSNSFKIVYGDKTVAEEMFSGRENAAYIDWYTQAAGNYFLTGLTPNQFSHWYIFTAKDTSATFTFGEYYDQLRFIVYSYDNSVIYDSTQEQGSHKTNFCDGFEHVEKGRATNLTIGNRYYLELFANESFSAEGIVTKNVSGSVGKPRFVSGSLNYAEGTKRISINSKSFSSDATIKVGDDDTSVPKTAVATRVQYVLDSSSNIRPSNISYWKIKAPNGTWKTSGLYKTTIDFDYKEDTSGNANINGDWKVAFKSSSNSYTAIPGLYIQYQYELGD